MPANREYEWSHEYPVGTCIRWNTHGTVWRIERSDTGAPLMLCVHRGTSTFDSIGDTANFPPTALGWPLPTVARVVTPCDCPRHQGTTTFHEGRIT